MHWESKNGSTGAGASLEYRCLGRPGRSVAAWRMQARGRLQAIGRGQRKLHLVEAVMETMTWRRRWKTQAGEGEEGVEPDSGFGTA
jgi:hypothetical protein